MMKPKIIPKSVQKQIKTATCAQQQYMDKIGFYLSKLQTDIDQAMKRKIVYLAANHILKQKANSQILSDAYKKVKDHTIKTHNYWGLQIIDYLVKNNKTMSSHCHSDLQSLFMGVFKEAKLRKQYDLVINLKLIWKTWTYIFQNKHIKNIKTKILSHCDQNLEDLPMVLADKVKEFVAQIDPDEQQTNLHRLLDSDSN